VDCPEITYLASRSGAGRFEHVIALRRIAADYARLLEAQQAVRADFLRTPVPGMPRSYTQIAALVQSQHPGGQSPLVSDASDFDALHERFEAEGGRLLEHLRLVPRESTVVKTGPASDRAVLTTAERVAGWTKQHSRGSGNRDWIATVQIMECHGWELAGRSLDQKAARLEDRVLRARKRGQLL
jgi:hypothetical protein